MRLLLFILFVGIILPQLCSQSSLLIQGAEIVDPAQDRILSNQDVWIERGTIQRIGPAQSIQVPEGTRLYPAQGRYLCPGWVDAHIHFFQSGGLYTRPDALDLRAVKPYEQEIRETRAMVPDLLARYLAAGITTVCDVGGPISNLSIRAQADSLPAPQVAMAGPLLSSYVPAALQTQDPPILLIKTAEEARAEVLRQVALEPDFVKIWFIILPGQSQEDHQEWVQAAIEESHRAGIPVAVHATQLETARLAVQLGADILVHSVTDRKVDPEFVQLLLANDVSYIPTLIVSGNYLSSFLIEEDFSSADFAIANPFTLGSLMDLNHLPKEQLPAWFQRLGAIPDTRQKDFELMAFNLRTLQEAGVNIVTGTDAGNIGTLHASSYFAEWEAMQRAGLSPVEILQASTGNAAKMLGQQGRSQVIAPGARADLVLLEQNPLTQLPDPEQIVAVFRDGEVHTPPSLLPQDPATLAQRQLNAYNARNIEAFLACYHPEVEIYDFPDTLRATGREAMRKIYGPMFEQVENLHCELVNRLQMGRFVTDREKVSGFGPGKMIDAVAIYEVQEGLIRRVYFLPN